MPLTVSLHLGSEKIGSVIQYWQEAYLTLPVAGIVRE